MITPNKFERNVKHAPHRSVFFIKKGSTDLCSLVCCDQNRSRAMASHNVVRLNIQTHFIFTKGCAGIPITYDLQDNKSYLKRPRDDKGWFVKKTK